MKAKTEILGETIQVVERVLSLNNMDAELAKFRLSANKLDVPLFASDGDGLELDSLVTTELVIHLCELAEVELSDLNISPQANTLTLLIEHIISLNAERRNG